MGPKRPGNRPPPERTGKCQSNQGEKSPKGRGTSAGSNYLDLVGVLDIQKLSLESKDGDGRTKTAIFKNSEPEPAETSQPQPSIGVKQRYRQDSHSGAKEGCSRDHHPEFYPEYWAKKNAATARPDQDRGHTEQASQPCPPSSTPPASASGSSGHSKSSAFKRLLKRSVSWALRHSADAESQPAKGASRKGKESLLTMEDRLWFMGYRPHPEVNEPTPQPAPTPAADTGPVIGGFVTYPQISGYHDPSRVDAAPLVVVNPDPGSEAERARDRAVQEQMASRTNIRSDSPKLETMWPKGRRRQLKKFLRLL